MKHSLAISQLLTQGLSGLRFWWWRLGHVYPPLGSTSCGLVVGIPNGGDGWWWEERHGPPAVAVVATFGGLVSTEGGDRKTTITKKIVMMAIVGSNIVELRNCWRDSMALINLSSDLAGIYSSYVVYASKHLCLCAVYSWLSYLPAPVVITWRKYMVTVHMFITLLTLKWRDFFFIF